MPAQAMDRKTFKEFCSLVYQKSGITLSDQKEALLCSRVGKRMRSIGFDSYKEYLKFVLEDQEGEEIVRLLDVISTNVTSFFREPVAFTCFREKILEWWNQGQKCFRVWSTACSTGEEPYSIAMAFQEAITTGTTDFKVLATDISTRVLTFSKEGIYPAERMKNVPMEFRGRYFSQEKIEGNLHYRVSSEIRRKIKFARLNLSTPPYPMRGPFDVVFCRNVMIYFDMNVRNRLICEIERLLKPDGLLILGQSEGLAGAKHNFKGIRPSIYLKA
jgi:chemotaxis protein methyltransferase CheR